MKPLIIILLLTLFLCTSAQADGLSLSGGEYISILRLSGPANKMKNWLGHEVERTGLGTLYILKVNNVCSVSGSGEEKWYVDFKLESTYELETKIKELEARIDELEKKIEGKDIIIQYRDINPPDYKKDWIIDPDGELVPNISTGPWK